MQDWHRWYDNVLFIFKASYRTQCCPEKAETLMTQIRVRIRVCQQKIEHSSKTANRTWKEHHGKCVRRFLKTKMLLEKKRQKVPKTTYTLRF